MFINTLVFVSGQEVAATYPMPERMAWKEAIAVASNPAMTDCVKLVRVRETNVSLEDFLSQTENLSLEEKMKKALAIAGKAVGVVEV